MAIPSPASPMSQERALPVSVEEERVSVATPWQLMWWRFRRHRVAVAESGSLVNAAEHLETSKAAVSRYVAQLEERLGVRLMQRTTRRQSLTDEGHAFLMHCKDTLALIRDAEQEIQNKRSNPIGLIRINAPLTFGILHLAPL